MHTLHWTVSLSEVFSPPTKKFHPSGVDVVAPGAAEFKNVLHHILPILSGRDYFVTSGKTEQSSSNCMNVAVGFSR